ncbi:alpha/beta hydrolase [Xanthocytophaga agilis]|uniref:Alpha/beta hydrolase n=1 Tax=Xanthocytophaga agilis TaxID=3048010 RepID=A0AAE3UFP7_9BACT|nr:alpha/beta hydrolase [Xanthocytophaga agilis]MDJ1501542.1 alpha/beta hydrolase [Xanthocytophaga agilis]
MLLKLTTLLTILLVCKIPILAQQKSDTIIPLKTLFQEAKSEFSHFEKVHGHVTLTPNGRMHYLTWGNRSGIPLVWSHGSLTNAFEVLPFVDQLVKAGYYVIAIDYYGHGQTPIPDHEVSLYHIADDIKCILDELKIRKTVIGGWSRGAMVSTAFYDTYPDRVLGIILEDGGSVSSNTYYHKMDSAQLTQRIDQLFKDRLQEQIFNSEFETYQAYYDPAEKGNQFSLLAWIRPTKNGKWALSPGVLQLLHMQTPEQFLENILYPTRMPLFAESMAILEPKIIYRNLSVPLLIIDPTHSDDLFPFETENARLQKQHPALIEHKIYPNTGHNVHYEHPDQFLKDVINFLKRIKQYNHLR